MGGVQEFLITSVFTLFQKYHGKIKFFQLFSQICRQKLAAVEQAHFGHTASLNSLLVMVEVRLPDRYRRQVCAFIVSPNPNQTNKPLK
jgi:hypothetical protein